MKESIADIWLLGIIIVFILIFACYITVTINYTASFKLKNEMLSIIERHKGLTDKVSLCNTPSNLKGKAGGNVCADLGAYQTINLYLMGNAYTAKGQCPNDGDIWYGVKELVYENSSSGSFEVAKSSEKYYYCFAKYQTGKQNVSPRFSTVYYKVRLFYKFEFPVLTEFLSVRVDGMTDEIYNPTSDPLANSIVENGAVF